MQQILTDRIIGIIEMAETDDDNNLLQEEDSRKHNKYQEVVESHQ